MLLPTREKLIDVLTDRKILIYLFSKIRIIVVVTLLSRRYLILPYFVAVVRNDAALRFVLGSNVDSNLEASFLADVNLWIKGISSFFRNKLILKGLGFKAGLYRSRSLLVLKLGYSKSLQISFLAHKFKIKVSKSVITIQGQNSSEVGDFARRIRQLRSPDAYKGKGFWYKDEVRVLKELKKK